MNLKERQDRILAMLRTTEIVEIGDLSKALDVSRETVRKDLYNLESVGLLTKVRGGAVLTSSDIETAYDLRKAKHSGAKKEIAHAAAKLIQPGDTVFLDYGTTSFMVAEELLLFESITVVTNTLPIVNLLIPNTNITIMIPGGIVRTNENSLYGPFGARNMENLFMNVGFFGCAGIDARAGITNHNLFETSFSTLAMEHCQKVVLLADQSKFDVIAAHKTASHDDIDLVITDEATSSPTLFALREMGAKVQIAQEG
jgi:DeoR family glycerol-3-phosphate regulon repressor